MLSGISTRWPPTQNARMSHVVPRELDLSHYGHDSIVDKINAVPGLKTSTGKSIFENN